LRRLYWVLFILLLLAPFVVNLVFISSIHNLAQRFFIRYRFTPSNILLKDILFIEGLFLIIFGWLSGEYIWNYFRNRKKNGRLSDQPAEFGVGLAFLVFGVTYVLTALLLP